MKALCSLSSAILVTTALAGDSWAQDFQVRMGEPVPGLTAAQLDRFVKGAAIFNKAFAPAEGRGPLFNDTACNGCHFQPRNGGSAGTTVTRFGKITTSGFDPLAQLGGSLLQANSNNPPFCDEVVPPEANVTAVRTTPPAFGMGLVEAIPDTEILANEAAQQLPLQGKAHIVTPLEGGGPKVGRFGWKAQVATALSFSGDASKNEMGLTNRLDPVENAPNGDPVKLAQCDTLPDPEDGPDGEGFDAIDRMADFQRFLAAPPQTPRGGMAGETLFQQIGCADCHRTTYVTGTVAEAALSNKTIHPYSDYLLHDIGTGDQIEFSPTATGNVVRTTPLWGLLPRAQNSLLREGTAVGGTAEQNVVAAILAHANEAAQVTANFNALSQADQDAVVRFLLSLGQTEFDHERDHDVDAIDWFFIEPFLTGPAPATPISPDDYAAINDVDADGDFDLRDVGAFQRAFGY